MTVGPTLFKQCGKYVHYTFSVQLDQSCQLQYKQINQNSKFSNNISDFLCNSTKLLFIRMSDNVHT